MRRREASGIPNRLSISLSPELTVRVARYHRESGLGGTLQDTARELVAAALDYPEVADSLLRNARLRAYLTVRREFEHLVEAHVAELDSTWRKQRDIVAPIEVEDGVSRF